MVTTVETKADLVAHLQQNCDTLRRFGVKRLGVFGSFQRQTQQPTSDIDLLVEFEPGTKTFRNYMGLIFWLEDTLGRSVDLLTTESLSPYIGPYILEEVEYVSLSETVFLKHILNEAIYLIESSKKTTYEAFMEDRTLKYAFVRSLEIIGEATKNLSTDLRQQYSYVA